MSQTLYCRDLFTGCDAIVRSDSRDDVVRQASEHACTVHGVCEPSPELERQIREAIRETR